MNPRSLLSRRRLLAGAVIVAGLGAGLPAICGLRARREGAAKTGAVDPVVGSAAPPLAGDGPDGSRAELSRYAGSVVLVNVWASWCQPCWREMPLLLGARRRWSQDGVVLFGLNTGDSMQQAAEFLGKVEAKDVPVVSDPDSRLAVRWGVRGVPETFAVDRAGTIAARRIGEVDQAWLDATIPPLLP